MHHQVGALDYGMWLCWSYDVAPFRDTVICGWFANGALGTSWCMCLFRCPFPPHFLWPLCFAPSRVDAHGTVENSDVSFDKFPRPYITRMRIFFGIKTNACMHAS